MTSVVLIFFGIEEDWMALPKEDLDEAVARIGQWFSALAGSGKIKQAARLQPKATTKTVKLGPAGKSEQPTVDDGPAFNLEYGIGSWMVIEVETTDEAVEIARTWPGGGIVEVRPLAE